MSQPRREDSGRASFVVFSTPITAVVEAGSR